MPLRNRPTGSSAVRLHINEVYSLSIIFTQYTRARHKVGQMCSVIHPYLPPFPLPHTYTHALPPQAPSCNWPECLIRRFYYNYAFSEVCTPTRSKIPYLPYEGMLCNSDFNEDVTDIKCHFPAIPLGRAGSILLTGWKNAPRTPDESMPSKID